MWSQNFHLDTQFAIILYLILASAPLYMPILVFGDGFLCEEKKLVKLWMFSRKRKGEPIDLGFFWQTSSNSFQISIWSNSCSVLVKSFVKYLFGQNISNISWRLFSSRLLTSCQLVQGSPCNPEKLFCFNQDHLHNTDVLKRTMSQYWRHQFEFIIM